MISVWRRQYRLAIENPRTIGLGVLPAGYLLNLGNYCLQYEYEKVKKDAMDRPATWLLEIN
jgi:hypothetical protein